MFPEETHEKILKRIDALEADAFRLYRKAASIRLDLQSQWHVLPTGEPWSLEKQRKAEDEVK